MKILDWGGMIGLLEVMYRVDTGEPVHTSQPEEEFDQIVQEVKRGDYITIEDLIKQKSSKW